MADPITVAVRLRETNEVQSVTFPGEITWAELLAFVTNLSLWSYRLNWIGIKVGDRVGLRGRRDNGGRWKWE